MHPDSIKISDRKHVEDVVEATQFHTFVRCGLADNGELLIAAKDIKKGDCLLTSHGKELVHEASRIPDEVSKASDTYSIVTSGGRGEMIAVGGFASHPTLKTKDGTMAKTMKSQRNLRSVA